MSLVRPEHEIAVIGAGACGLCAAKYLTEAGFDVTIFEIGTQIGGLWRFMNDNGRSSAYRTLHINTSRGVTRFHDLDFDIGVQDFPDHEDMHSYLTKYADHFGLVDKIRFQSRVVDICPEFNPEKREQPIWKVVLENGTQNLFASVVVASQLSHCANMTAAGLAFLFLLLLLLFLLFQSLSVCFDLRLFFFFFFFFFTLLRKCKRGGMGR